MTKRIDPAFAPVAEAFARTRGVELAPMFASTGLRCGKRFFAIGVHGELVLKLPAARVRELIADAIGRPFTRGEKGPPMKEWVRIPARAGDWIALAREAHQHAKGAKR